jgi:hypothetical protein
MSKHREKFPTMTIMLKPCLVDPYGLNEQKQSDEVLGFNPTRDWVTHGSTQSRWGLKL